MLEFCVKPEIEVFDAAMLYNAADLVKRGPIKRPLHVQFVMGIPNAMPARRTLLEFLVGEMKEILPDATWSALGMARNQLVVNKWCLEMGGHTRMGMEDNVRIGKDRLAASNTELVTLVVKVAGAYGRRPRARRGGFLAWPDET